MVLEHVKNNWFCYLIAVFVFLIGVWLLLHFLKVKPIPENTFYFQVTDEGGNESIVHDSGIKPTLTPPETTMKIQVLKKEYNNGKSSNISKPALVRLGLSPKDLEWVVTPQKVVTEDDFYTVEILTPDHKIHEKDFKPEVKKEEINVETKVE